MKNKIISVLALVLVLIMSLGTCFAADAPTQSEAQDYALFVKSAKFDEEIRRVNIVITNRSLEVASGEIIFAFEDTDNTFILEPGTATPQINEIIEIPAGGEVEFEYDVNASMNGDKYPVLSYFCGYQHAALSSLLLTAPEFIQFEEKDVLNVEPTSKLDAVINFLKQTGFSMTDWKSLC